MRSPSWRISFAVTVCAVTLAAACSLSPQPLPPGETYDGGKASPGPTTPIPSEGPADGSAFNPQDGGQRADGGGPVPGMDAGNGSPDATSDADAGAGDADASDAGDGGEAGD